MIYKEIKACRICGNSNLVKVLNLSVQKLTGVFPKKGEVVEEGPLVLVKCNDSENSEACGLLQLKHNYDLELMYGDNYGYRSGLNNSMVKHLESIVRGIESKIQLNSGDLVIDIASNDGTLLKAYKNKDLRLVGIDPTSAKFKNYYPDYIQTVPKFFSKEALRDITDKKAKVVTSIAMFYDLENPMDFMKDVYDVLDNDGIWVLEQSYMPGMIKALAYDTVCHEHLEYYALKQIKWMADKVGFEAIDFELNDTNGASFYLVLAKKESKLSQSPEIVKYLEKEKEEGYSEFKVFDDFDKKVKEHRQELINFLNDLKSKGKKVFGYGASTKGNVILQYCDLGKFIPCIAEVNEYKFGRVTPGTEIPIISEEKALTQKPDYFFVLPWHFKNNILEREKAYLSSGGHFIFPLPKIEIV